MLAISSLARIQRLVAPWTQIMKARLESSVIFLSFTILYLSSISEAYLITTTISQLDQLSSSNSKQDVNNFHISTPKLLHEFIFPSGQVDVDAVLALISARLSYIPFFNKVQTDPIGCDCHSSSQHTIKSTNWSARNNPTVRKLRQSLPSLEQHLSPKFTPKKGHSIKKEKCFE
ncbi:hypothetical protein PTTG_26277 [Puccinia triticina 1-1 BBBD Race 1]|uniref:Uncharacterized protein n=3 Tax=Puccinia triticina TaxID=208348 RepID=A0A180GW66_PUCT1|nr:hypothetical protein PTTG_26277 [Puccinia triticina 1-1 BBBD Race 1]